MTFFLPVKARAARMAAITLSVPEPSMRNISIDGHEAVDQLGQLQLVFVEQAGHRAAGLQQLEDLLAHGRVVAAQHGRAAGLQEVDVAVAVHVPQVGAVGFLDRQREGIVEGQVVLHAAGDDLFGFVGQRLSSVTHCVSK